MGFCGQQPSRRDGARLRHRPEARDRAIQCAPGRGRGEAVNCAATKWTTPRAASSGEQGFAEYFFHRTGHSIGNEVHGTGANMDNLETHDERKVIPGTCFSVEPGIYLPEFGVRSEVNVYVDRAQRSRHRRKTGNDRS